MRMEVMRMRQQVQYTTALRRVLEKYPTLPPRERGEAWPEYLRRLEDRLRVLEAAWGDWMKSPPRPEQYLEDPHWAWAWPKAREEIYLLRMAIPELKRALKGVRHA